MRMAAWFLALALAMAEAVRAQGICTPPLDAGAALAVANLLVELLSAEGNCLKAKNWILKAPTAIVVAGASREGGQSGEGVLSRALSHVIAQLEQAQFSVRQVGDVAAKLPAKPEPGESGAKALWRGTRQNAGLTCSPSATRKDVKRRSRILSSSYQFRVVPASLHRDPPDF